MVITLSITLASAAHAFAHMRLFFDHKRHSLPVRDVERVSSDKSSESATFVISGSEAAQNSDEASKSPTPQCPRSFFKRHGAMCFWFLWVVSCFTTLVCLLPGVTNTAMWLPHLHLHIDKTYNLSWVSCLDEGLQIISYYATDLNGISRDEYNLETFSQNYHHFDFASWCRESPHTSDLACYRGNGLDIISSLVADIGTQVGEAGGVKNPVGFGFSLAKTFGSVISDIDQVYHATRNITGLMAVFGFRDLAAAPFPPMDVDKLAAVHRLFATMKFGRAMKILKVVHTAGLFILCIAVTLNMWKGDSLGRRKVWAVAFILSLMILCEICTFAICASETLFINKLSAAFRHYGIIFTMGCGYSFLAVEFLLGLAFGIACIAW